MNVEIGTESSQFPEKEYVNGIFVAVCKVFLLCIYLHAYSENICDLGSQAPVPLSRTAMADSETAVDSPRTRTQLK